MWRQARGGHGDGALNSRRSGVLQLLSRSIAMHAKLASQSESIAPVAAFSLSNQPDHVRFEAHRRFVRRAG